MPDNRITLTIEAQNLASQAFKQFQTDVRQSNEALQKAGQAGRQGSGGIKVFRDELGRFHDTTTGKFVSAARLLREGFTEVERGADGSTEAIKRVNPVIARMRREYNLLRTDIHNTAAVTRQFATAIQSQIRSQVDAAANLERLRVGLVSIGGSLAAATTQYQRLVEVSRLPGINIENSLRATLQLEALGKSGEEATEIIQEFGNALALSGTAPRELNQVVNAIRQMSGEGKILQEDIAILTTRVAALVPHLKDAFGGTRAKDVRQFFDALGVEESEQADRFLRIVLDRLKELPRAGDTAANAIENLNDTFGRVQATIGANFLPLVKESTAALEAFLMQAEQDEGLARNIATVEAFGASWLTVTAALTGVAAAIPAVSAAVSFLFTGPAAIAVGVVATLTAGLVAWKVASQEVESEVDSLNSTIDRNRRALISYQEAVTSGQLGDIQSAQRGIQAQRQQILRDIEGLIAERLNIEEQRDKLQSQINYQEFTGFEPSRARQDRLGELDAQAQNLRKAIEVARFEFLELGQSGRHLNELGKPLVDANVNTEKLTKSIKDLKEELQEEVTFEDVSRGLLGNEADFRKSATALADVEALLRLNTDAYEELEKAAASGNQEAVEGLSAVNKELNTLRDTAADRHIDNLSAAFKNLTSATDPSRKQFEAILKSAEAFAVTFQGGADVLQDDVARASELIGNIRSQLQDLSSDEITLELHAEGAQSLSEALLRFYDLQRDVQEDATLDARQSAEQQATAYIRAYRDSIDPAILNLVESVRLLREEVRGTIQDLEALNLQDELRIELNAENLSPVTDFFTELVDLQQAAQGDLTRSQIDSLEKRSQALRQYLSDDTANFVAYASDIEAIDETLQDKSLSLLEGVVQARQAQYDDDLRSQRQAEQAKRQENEKTYDFDVYLAGLRTKSRQQASQDLIRLEERALDASSQRQRENLIRDTQQFIDAYAERGTAFMDLVGDAQDLGSELQQAFDLTEQTRRLEDFRDGVADVLQDLASVALDHIFDGFFGAADEATIAIQTFTDVFRGDIELLENDVTRLTRQVEDSKIRLLRLDEDGERRIRQLERQRRSVLARGSTGNQKDAERTRQRAQDISFQIAQVREDAAVRRSRAQEDADRRRNRAIADAEGRRDRALARQEGDSLLSEIQASLTDATVNALSSAISTGLGSLLSSPLEKIAGFLAGGLASTLGDLFGGLFGGDGDGDGDGTGTPTTPQTPDAAQPQTGQGDADVAGTIKTLTVDPDLATPTVDVAGLIKSAAQAAEGQYTIPTINAKGRITTAELSEGAALPSVPGLKGGIDNIVLQMNVQLPIVPGLTGTIGTFDLAETIEDLPNIAGLEGRIDALSLSTEAATGLSVSVAGIINALTLEGTLPTVTGLTGTIEDVLISPDIDPPSVDGLHGIISTVATSLVSAPQVNVSGLITSLSLLATAPALEGLTAAIEDVALSPDIDPPSITGLHGRIDTIGVSATPPTIDLTGLTGTIGSVALSPDIDPPTITDLAGRIDSVTLDPDIDLPTIRIPATAVVGPVVGGRTNITRSIDDEEDPENPMLGSGLEGSINSLNIDPEALSAISPVMLAGVITPTLDLSMIVQPIRLKGIIEATVQYLTGADQGGGGQGNQGQGGGGGGGGGAAEDPVQRSQVAADLSTIANVLENAAVSGNLNPALGDTPQVDIPSPNLDIDNEPVPGATHPQGFAEALRNANQFRPGAGGGHAGQAGTLRVALPTETLSRLAQQETLLKQFTGANQHLAIMRTFIANEMFPSLNTQLTEITDALNSIRIATEKTAEAPLVERLVDAGVAFPNDPQDPTNAALTQSPIQDILSQGGLSLFAGFDNIDKNLQTLLDAQSQAQGTPDLSVIPGTDPSNPMYIVDVNRDTPRKVEIVGGNVDAKIVNKTLDTNVVNTVGVKHVGALAVTQSGEWVMQLASGSTVPVYVQGGRLVADIAGGLEGLAVNLADTETGLRAVGAI